MKLLLTTMCAALFISPLAFAEGEGKKCDKKCKDKEAKEETIAHCGKCKKDGEHKDGEKKEEAKKEGTMIAEAGEKKCCKSCEKECCKKAKEGTLLAETEGKKCDKKCDKDKEAKEGTLVDCKKCDKDKKKEEEAKKEGTLMAEAEKKKCDKKCDKEKEAEKEATFA